MSLGATLVLGAIKSAEANQPLYRGYRTPNVPQAGDRLDLPISSFSGTRSVAESFAQTPYDGESVIFEIDAGNVRALDVSKFMGKYAKAQDEWLTYGAFDVISSTRDPETGVHVVKIRERRPGVTP
jgi:hypothetical protein